MATNTDIVIRIVDDDEEFTKSLRDYLTALGWQVEAFTSSEDFLNRIDPSQPGCIVLDIEMPEKDGLVVQYELNSRKINLPIIFLSAHGTIPIAVHTLQKGAVTFLEKPASPIALQQAILKALSRSVQENHTSHRKIELEKRFDSLTMREKEVVQFIGRGCLNKTIADKLNISLTTVKTHRGNAFAKLGVTKATELVKVLMLIGQANVDE